MGLDIQGKGFHDMGVNEVNCKIGEIVEMNWSTAKTRFYGTQQTVIKPYMTGVSQGHKD